MLRARYAPVCLFDLVPQLRLAFEPELAELDRLLEDDVVFERVKADLARRRPRSLVTGRPSTPVEVVLRLLVVRHRYRWSYEQTERFVNDSLGLRQVCRRGLAPVPDDTTLLRWANLLRPGTLHRLLDRVVELARSLRVTRGRKLRLDSTVVETDVHHPADSTLLADGVRVLSRRVRRTKAALGGAPAAAGDLWRDRPRSAERVARRLGATLAHGRPTPASEPERRGLYRRLLDVARASRRQASRVRELVAAAPAAARLRAALDRFLPLVERVIAQAARRGRRGERVPAAAKVLSLFEAHTALIRRGTARQPTEFGAKVVLDEVAGGLVTAYRLLVGNADDGPPRPPARAHHQACFRQPPYLVAADRHVFSADKVRQATAAGVRRAVLPYRGGGRPPARLQERARWFRRGHRFRAGIEGRISVLRRRFGPRRCRYRGPDGLERWVGPGLLAHNLRAVGRALARRHPAAAA